MLTRSLPALVVLAIIFALTSSSTQAQEALGGDELQRDKLLQLREVPEDRPGEPAQPTPGAPATSPIRFGRFVSVQVNVGPGGSNIFGDAANEPSIAVDPTNPLRMALGWRQFDTVSSNFRQAGWAYSKDGGRTWTFPGVIDPGNFRSDPVLSFNATGNFYYSSLESNLTCDVFTSTDRGVTWGPEVYAYGGDKQWLAVDRSGGIGDGNVYSSWSGSNDNIFTRSTDGAQSFEPPTPIPNAPRWGTIDVGPDGTVYVIGNDGGDLSRFYVSMSIDAQDPMSTPTFSSQIVDMGGSINFMTGPNPEGLLGQPWIAVDPSDGPTAGYIYLLCSINPPGGDPLDIHFVRSTDGGSTWSPPLRVNDDPGTSAWQWFGTMSVGHNGRIDAIWNDTRNTGAANLSQLYYSFSEDGGATWSVNQPLSPVWDSYVGWPNQDKIGDYYDMVSDRVGADLAWAATFNDEQDVYYLRINDYDCNGNGVGDSTDIAQGHSPDTNGNGIPDECEDPTDVPEVVTSQNALLRNSPNPFTSATTIEFNVSESHGPFRLQIFDAEGRLVRTLLDGFASPGVNAVRWDGMDGQGRPVAPGLYFYRLMGRDLTETGRMLLVK